MSFLSTSMKHKSVPLNAESIIESVLREMQDYWPYSDYDLPFLLFGDFHSARKEEQKRFLLNVSYHGNLQGFTFLHCTH